jgi:hypothetical protein
MHELGEREGKRERERETRVLYCVSGVRKVVYDCTRILIEQGAV